MDLNNLLQTPLFGITISIIGYIIGVSIFEKYKLSVLNPILIASGFIMLFLYLFNIDMEVYKIGGNIITFFIAPATVALAIPLYKNIHYLKKRFFPIIIAIIVGSAAGLITVIILGNILNVDITIIKSLLPKSTTAAIGYEISELNGGIVELTAIFIIATGTIGTIISKTLYKILKIDDKIAIGLGLGTTSHVMGTTEALKLGEVEGALSSVGLSIAGIVTVFLVPFFIKILL